MHEILLAFGFAVWLGITGPAIAQHTGPSPSGAGVTREQDINTISITPVSPVQPLPVVQVESAPLPDIGPDRVMERYLDGLFAGQIVSGRIPGAAVVVVRNGAVVLKKGYGVMDLDSRKPVDPDTTQFRVASISKLFTALLVMQEVEAGRLRLEADVNTYLKTIQLSPAGPDPVTLESLLDHTSGFDDKYIGMARDIGAPAEPLDALFARSMPRLVLPVGKVFNYSNYGYALAGHLAAQAAGQDFRSLMAERFFGPLNMTRSSFGVPEPVPGTMATPYRQTPQGLKAGRLDQVAVYPAGDLVTTADDLSRFMIALLSQGDGLVRPETLTSMRSAHIVPGKTGEAWGLGFALGENNGVSWFGHGGAWPGFAAEMRLNADTRSGFLILVNTDNRFDIVQPLVNGVTDALWPDEAQAAIRNVAGAARDPVDLTGTYLPVRRARDDFTAFGAALSSIRLTEADGMLHGTIGGMPQTLVFEPVRDGVWRERTYRWKLSAYDGGGGATREGILLGPFAFERAGFAGDLAYQSPWLAAVILVFAGVLLAWGGGALSRKLFGEPMPAVRQIPRIMGAAAASLGLVYLAGFGSVMANLNDQDILSEKLGVLPVLLCLPAVIAPLTLMVAVFAVRGFGSGLRARLAQGGFILLTLALIFLLWFVWTWNLHIFAR